MVLLSVDGISPARGTCRRLSIQMNFQHGVDQCPRKNAELVKFKATQTFKEPLKVAAETEKRIQSNFLDKLLLNCCDNMASTPRNLRQKRESRQGAKPRRVIEIRERPLDFC
ncbi:MAG: hypothetical protein ABI196_02110 [Bradyrhizobium sp.]